MTAPNSAIAEWRRSWFLPLAAALGYSSSVLHIYSIGPFIEPLQQDFGWSRAQVTFGISIASIVAAIFCIPMGVLVDRIGPRRVGLIGVPLMSVMLALLGTASGTQANWMLLWAVVAFGAIWVQAPVWTAAVATRFTVSRGFAFAITLCGASLSATVFPVLSTWLIGKYGWRLAFVYLGAIWAALVVPVLLLCFRGARDGGKKAQAAKLDQSETATIAPGAIMAVAEGGLTFAEGLRSPTLYKLLIAGSLFSFTTIAALVHFVPILRGAGATAMAAAETASLIGIFSIVGRFSTGLLLDRFPGHRVGAAVFMLPIIMSVLLLSNGANSICQAIAAAALGFTVGSEVDVVAFLASKHFGLRSFGALYGALVMALTLGTAFGPLTAGAVFDHYGSYAPFLLGTIALMLTSAAALLSLGNPPVLAKSV